MQRLLFICLIALIASPCFAQEYKQHLVKAGQIPEKAIPAEEIYFFNAFKNGVAIHKNNSKSQMKFNYNCLVDELQFLTPAGDTLSIAEPELLWKIEIDSVSYFYQKGYLRQISKHGKFSLAVRERLTRADSKKQAAYGSSSSTSAIDNFSNIYRDGRVFRLELKQDMVFRKAQQLYLGNAYDHFIRADKRGFSDLFPSKRDAMSQYIKEEKINFGDPEDIKKLFLFCAGGAD